MLALTADDIRALVPMRDAIALMKEAFRELSGGMAVAPLRTPIEVAPEQAVALFMPAAVPSVGGLGLKVVSVFPNNPTRGLPTIHALVCLIDPATGAPLAIMDGTYLTTLRTGAVSGAATDFMARQDARVLALFGAGAQAGTQAEAICAVRAIEEIRVVARSDEKGAAFINRLRVHAPEVAGRVRIVLDSANALRDADVVCMATPATAALFADDALAPGTHINAVGAYTPTMQEVPPETVARSRIVVDQREAAWAEAGDLVIARDRGLIAEEDIYAELGELVSGAKSGRQSPTEITFFKSVGNAVQDIAVGRCAVDRAASRGLGQTINLNPQPPLHRDGEGE